MKSIFGFISLVVVSSFTLCLKEPINFEYKYKVISASNSPTDIQQAYIYKEKLIEQYEKLVFNFEERDYQQIIKDNISSSLNLLLKYILCTFLFSFKASRATFLPYIFIISPQLNLVFHIVFHYYLDIGLQVMIQIPWIIYK